MKKYIKLLGILMSLFKKTVPTPVSSKNLYILFGMPATMLSIFSMITLITVFFFLQKNELLKELFKIPEQILILILVLSTILSFIIMLFCAKRPGGIWYRYWNLLLFLLNLGILILYFLPIHIIPFFQAEIQYFISSSLFDVTVCAIASATFVLLPRLISLSVNSWWLSRISLISLLVVLGFTATTIHFGQAEIISGVQSKTLTTIQAIKKETKIINNSHYQSDKKLAVKALLFKDEFWRKAKIFKLNQTLFEVSEQKISAVASKIDKVASFSLENITDPAIYYDETSNKWVNNKQFILSVKKTLSYYHYIQTLLKTIQPDNQTSLTEDTQELNHLYQLQTQRFEKMIDNLQGSWLNASLHNKLIGNKKLSLTDFLSIPIIKEKSQYNATNPWQWLSMPLNEAKQLEQEASTGCRFSEYDAKRKQYFRMDCYAYNDFDKNLTTPLIEMRIVYAEKNLNEESLPRELYYIFPIPKRVLAENYKTNIISSFIAEIRKENSSVRVRNNRSSAKDGVSLTLDNQKISIHRLRRKNYFKQQDMIELRIEKKY